MKATTILAVAAAFLLIPFISKAVNAVQLQFSFDRIYSFRLQFPNVVITLQFEVVNPSKESYTVNSLSGTLYVDDDQVATVNVLQPFVIAPQSSQLYSVPVTLPILGTIINLVDILQGQGSGRSQIRFSGYVRVEDTQLPIDKTITV